MAAANGLSRRRHRITTLGDLPEEEELMELQETARLRDRVHKKHRDRDRELSNRSKRRRGDRYVYGSNRGEGEVSTDDSVDNEKEDYDEEDRRVPRVLPSNHSSSSSISNHSYRRSLAPARVVHSSLVWKSADDIIGVSVPRKARSASAKRLHEYGISGSRAFGEEQSRRRPLFSSASRGVNGVSPSPSGLSLRKKCLQIPIGPKTRLPKVSSKHPQPPPFSVEDDIEIEVAEALYDLMKHSHSQTSKKQERSTQNSTEDLDSKITNCADNKSVDSPVASVLTVPRTPILPRQNSSSSSALLSASESSKTKRSEDEKDEEPSAAVLRENGSSVALKAGTELQAEVENEISSPKSVVGAAVPLGSQKEEAAVKQDEDTKHATQKSESGDEAVIKGKVLAPKVESPSYAKLDASDPADSTAKKMNLTVSSVAEFKGEVKFEIDLMENESLANVERNEVGEQVEKKPETIFVRQELPKLNLEKPYQHNISISGSNKLRQQGRKQQNRCKAPNHEGEKFVQSSSLPLPIAVAGWPGSASLGRYMPPLQTIVPMNGIMGSSNTLQPPHFLLSQHRPKRCVTHHYIAHNIFYHQQLSKKNHIWPGVAGPAFVQGANPCNLNVMPSAQNMIIGSPLQGIFPGGNMNKVHVSAAVLSCPEKDNSSEVANLMDAAQKKQLVLQKSPHPVPAGNLLHGPALIFPQSQHQSAVPATANQSRPPKSATSTGKVSLSGNSATGAPVNSSSLSAFGPVLSFDDPHLPANEPPYMAILQNKGYPFPISTHFGMPPQIKGGAHAATMTIFNGPFYSPQMYHTSRVQQHQPHAPLFQPSHQDTSTSGGSSSSHKQPDRHQHQAMQVIGNRFFTSMNMQFQQPQKQLLPQSILSEKLEADVGWPDNSLLADSRVSHSKKGVHRQNFAVPSQPVNFAQVPPATLDCAVGNNNTDNKQQGSQGGVELIPHQAFALSLAAGTSAQNPAIFQMLPDVDRHGYQISPIVPQVIEKKHFQTSDGKTEANSTNLVSSYITENQPSSSTLTAMTTSVSNNPSNSQQQQLNQLQKQHMLLLMDTAPVNAPTSTSVQLRGTTPVKAPPSICCPLSSMAAKFQTDAPVLSHTLIQNNSSTLSPMWKNSGRTSASQVPPSSLVASTTSTVEDVAHQEVRIPHRQSQISFGGSPKSATTHGQQIAIAKQSASPLAPGPPPNFSISKSPGGSLRTASTGKVSSQQTESSLNGACLKSSPVCGRNMP